MADATPTTPETTSGTPNAETPKGKGKAKPNDRGTKTKVMGVELYIKG